MDEKIETKDTVETKKGGFNFKILLIGIPLFVIQLVAVYFITANFLVTKNEHADQTEVSKEGESGKTGDEKNKTKKSENIGKFFFTVDDIIVNPAGTNGQRLMLTSVGFGVESEEELNLLKAKDVLIKDVIISTFSAKTLAELNQIGYKDTLKIEISERISERIPDVAISNVFFSKYIIQ